MTDFVGQTYAMPIDGRWEAWSDVDLAGPLAGVADGLKRMYGEYCDNRIANFLPHGGGRDFLNDYENDVCMLVAPNRVGKSCHGTAWTILRSIPTDPCWATFTKNGVRHMPWRGPRVVWISSYSWDNVAEVWKEYQRWLPRYELGPYAEDWGSRPGEDGRQKALSFGDGKPKRVKLTCGTEFVFLCDGQSDAAWEGKRCDEGHFDEQREEEKFIGYLRGTSNTQGLVQCCFTLTGHIIDNRPDTGAGGWIKRKLFDGTYTYGRKVGRYKISVEDVPDVVLSPDRKRELRRQWVEEPQRLQDRKKLRQAEARYWGGWETGSGLVIDNFDRRYHIIPTFRVPKDWTLYRGVDHGRESPTAGLWLAVAPWGDRVFYREYYFGGRTIPHNCREIVAASGNERVVMRVAEDVMSESTWQVYREVFKGERYFASVLDVRSFQRKSDERPCTTGQMYNDFGLTVSKSSGHTNEMMVPRMNAAMEIDPKRPHIMVRLLENRLIDQQTYNDWLDRVGGDVMCGSRQYVMGNCTAFVRELEGWVNDIRTGKPRDEDDHLMSTWRFLECEEPRFMGDWYAGMDNDDGMAVERSEAVESTGYKFVGG